MARMSRFDRIRARSSWRDILEGQAQHMIILALTLCGTTFLLEGSENHGRFLGLGSLDWAWLSIWVAVVHQLIVAFSFRLQLHRAIYTRVFGKWDFAIFQLIFMPLLVARPITATVTGVLDAGSLGGWRAGEILLGSALIIIAVYTLHSVIWYFTIPRAAGGDHFRVSYHTMPLVSQGVFRWSGNSMYSFGFLLFWGIALVCGSWQALAVAFFQHTYIWIHMYTVEEPDMRWLYGPGLEENDRKD